MRIHEGWLAQEKPQPQVKKEQPVRHGIEPQECSACHDYYIPANAAQVFCTRPNCVRDRATKRQQERRRLQRWMKDAERKKKQYDGMAKAQVAAVKRAFREARSLN